MVRVTKPTGSPSVIEIARHARNFAQRTSRKARPTLVGDESDANISESVFYLLAKTKISNT